jgi:DNA adenine methylase
MVYTHRVMYEPSPFLKWVGGKGQLLARLLGIFPTSMHTFYEPFIGGGAVFFALAKREAFQRAVINDINQELMDAYRIVRDFPEDLISQLKKLKYDPDVFDQLRRVDVSRYSPVRRAARTIYLNKTCFNGLYRVNKSGQFNVSFGKFSNPSIYNEAILRSDARALEMFVWLQSIDFEESCSTAVPGDLVFLDPPYVPLNDTSYFTSYTKSGFGIKEQERLAAMFRTLSTKNVQVVASNSNSPIVRELYKGFHFTEVQAKRCVNSKGDKRGPITELIITNYEVPSADLRVQV